MSKIKHNIEYQFINGYKVVDPVNCASNQAPIYMGVTNGSVSINPIDSNYFVVDLGGTGSITFDIIDNDNISRFEVLLLEPVKTRTIIWADNIIFPEDFYTSSDFSMKDNIRREMLITFKNIGNGLFLAIPTCWFMSPNLENNIVFDVINSNGVRLEEVEVTLTGGGYDDEIKIGTRGVVVFNRSKNESYNWSVYKEGYTSDSGAITEGEINQDYPVIIEVVITEM